MQSNHNHSCCHVLNIEEEEEEEEEGEAIDRL